MDKTATKTIRVTYFSDILCVWAYIAQLRLDAVERTFGERVIIEPRFCAVFGDTARKVPTTWADKGGYAGFNAHLRHSAAGFPEIELHPDLWLSVRPASSLSPHLYLKAVQLAEAAGDLPRGALDRTQRAFRRAFFAEARDIARRDIQAEIGRAEGVDDTIIADLLRDGRAHAALSSDYQDAAALGVTGSPSFVLNEGRQKLYGNVGFRVIEANLREALRAPSQEQASWC